MIRNVEEIFGAALLSWINGAWVTGFTASSPMSSDCFPPRSLMGPGVGSIWGGMDPACTCRIGIGTFGDGDLATAAAGSITADRGLGLADFCNALAKSGVLGLDDCDMGLNSDIEDAALVVLVTMGGGFDICEVEFA